MRRSMPMFTALMGDPKNWRDTFPAAGKTARYDTPDGPEARFFHRIGQFTNAQNM